MKTDEREVWRTIKSIEGGQEEKGKKDIIVSGGRNYVTDKKKADLFVKNYKAESTLKITKENRIVKKMVIKHQKQIKIRAREESEKRRTLE